MRSAVIFCALFVAAFAALDLPKPLQFLQALKLDKHLNSWEDFKNNYGKKYESAEEEMKRFAIFVDHMLKIEQHNAEEAMDGRHGFETGTNEFADMTSAEFVKTMNGLKINANEATSDNPQFLEPENVVVPDAVDWRTKGYVTPVKNQGQCGSCWAFSTTGSLEGQHFRKSKKLVSLSEQNLVDCSNKYGNLGCSGGLMDQAFRYIKDNHGIDTEASYPYTARDGTCKFKKQSVGATDTGFVDIPRGNETALKNAVATIGPISVAIDASHWSFQMYKSGIYNERECSSTQLDHGVLAVGYGSKKSNFSRKSKDYWIVKNSWGATYGQNGYILMSRNKRNQCGIATQASYPLV